MTRPDTLKCNNDFPDLGSKDKRYSDELGESTTYRALRNCCEFTPDQIIYQKLLLQFQQRKV